MNKSQTLFERAKKVIPGGVNSPVRAFKSVGGDPLFIVRGEGPYLFDADGQRYIDYVASWGPLILGHAHSEVVNALQNVVTNGTSYGACTEVEVLMAEKITQLMPSIEMVRMVNSGTEATMSALRLARGYTKRDKILKFIGCYHGHNDALLAKAGSGNLTLSLPDSIGVPAEVTADTLLAEYNDLSSVERVFEKYGEQIAAVIVEPVAGNMSCVLPVSGFLQGLRTLCDRYRSVLIFDEVMTGFRVALGGAQEIYHVKPDLTTLGKIIGGGLPVGAFGGKAEIMQCLAPIGAVYQAGTLSGNPLAMQAGLTALNTLSQPGFYEPLTLRTQRLLAGLQEIADHHRVDLHTHQVGSMFGLFFNANKKIIDLPSVKTSNIEHYQRFFHHMLKRGVYFAPSAFEAGFISVQHTDAIIDETLKIADSAFGALK